MSATGTILLTGANGGLGSAIVTEIVKSPDLAAYHGVYTVRNAASAPQLKQALAGAKSHKHDIVDLDLSTLASVRNAAGDVNRRVAAGEWPPIRALILNAAYQDHTQLVSISVWAETTSKTDLSTGRPRPRMILSKLGRLTSWPTSSSLSSFFKVWTRKRVAYSS